MHIFILTTTIAFLYYEDKQSYLPLIATIYFLATQVQKLHSNKQLSAENHCHVKVIVFVALYPHEKTTKTHLKLQLALELKKNAKTKTKTPKKATKVTNSGHVIVIANRQ